MRTIEQVRDLLWKSLTDEELLRQVPPRLQIQLTEMGVKCRPNDGTLLDVVIHHFAAALVRDDITTALLVSTALNPEELPC